MQYLKNFACISKRNLIELRCCKLIGEYTIKEVRAMARCAVCDKGAHFGIKVSHSHRRSNKMWKSNIKKVKVNVNGTPKKMYVCTSCLKSGLVERA